MFPYTPEATRGQSVASEPSGPPKSNCRPVISGKNFGARSGRSIRVFVLGKPSTIASASNALGAQMLYHRPEGAALHTVSSGLKEISEAFFREGWHINNSREVRAHGGSAFRKS
jgi:hypothetical protein